MAAVRREVFDAFKSIGVADEQAWKAAEALSDTGEHLTQLENRLEMRMAKIEGRLDLLSWMVGLSIALNVAILLKLLIS